MPRKAIYTTLPSKRNGHLLTWEDRKEITKNFLDACANVMGFTYTNLTFPTEEEYRAIDIENEKREKERYNKHFTE